MKIKTKGNGEIHTGNGSTFTCDSVHLENFITKATINIGVDEIVTGSCDVALTGVEIDGAVLKINGIDAPEELVNALRDYFKGNKLTDAEIDEYRNLAPDEFNKLPMEIWGEITYRMTVK